MECDRHKTIHKLLKEVQYDSEEKRSAAVESLYNSTLTLEEIEKHLVTPSKPEYRLPNKDEPRPAGGIA